MLSALRQTLRRLAHEKGFTATVLLTLALCLGANIAIFAVVDAILVRPLPFPEADRLVTTINSYPKAGAERGATSLPNYYDRRKHIAAFASTAAHQDGSAIVGDAGSPTRVIRDRVSPDFFATLGVPLALGRAFTEDEMVYANAQHVILTDAYWRNHFNSDPGIIGKTMIVDSLPNTIVGVLPPGFRYLSTKAQFYIPLASNLEDREVKNRHSNNLQLIARLAPGATLADAQAQIDAFNQEQLKDDPYAEIVRNAGYRTGVYSLHADHVRDVRPILLLLQAGVLALLLIGAVNLVNLLLIRANGRAKEYAVRQALGAGRRHMLGEIMLETVLLSLGGGLLGLIVGAFGIDLMARFGADQLPLSATIQFDGRVAAVSLAGSLLLGVVLALPIVIFNLRNRLAPVLHSESRSGTVTRAAQRVRHGFIIAQVALAFVLLSGAGLLGVSLQKILSARPGFTADHVLTGSLALPWKNYPDEKPRLAFIERLYEALRSQPGVTAVGFTSGLPFAGRVSNNGIVVEGVELVPGETIRAHYTSFASGDYWKALGIPLLEGRFLEEGDNHREQRVCVVDAEFARRYWPGKSALGRRLVNGPTFEEKEATTIVGVVGVVKQIDLSEPGTQGAIYFPYKDYSSTSFSVVLRTPLEPAALGAMLQKTVLSLDSSLPVDDLKSMQTLVDDSLVSRRSPAVLAGAFAVVALLLAAIGTYGVLAYAVNQRTREIGVRMALGALPRQVLFQFLGLGGKLLLAGILLGLLGSWAAGRAMQSLLFGVGSVHPGVLVVAAGTMMVVVLLATFIPSRRATLVSPIEALRTE
jgi:predicted permease